MNYIAIFATSNREFFETLQNKERKETRSFLSRSPYQIIYSAFISNQSITFTPLLLFGGNRYILSGIILHRTSILYLKWYKSIDLAELHNVEHLI